MSTAFFGRRDFLKASAVIGAAKLGVSAAGHARAQVAEQQSAGRATPFDFQKLRAKARALAHAEYKKPTAASVPAVLRKLDWDDYESLHFRPDRALWADAGLPFRVKFFHLGFHYSRSVQMYEVAAGSAHEIDYSPSLFDFGRTSLSKAHLPRDLGFAGFQLMMAPDFTRDVAAFLGASYFRAVGGEMQFGLSGRGLAIDCGLDRPEEFPEFTAYWLERPNQGDSTVTVYALLESPSATGAYRFRIHPSHVLVMDVDACIYLRRPVQRLGIAPLTSMYLCGENDRRIANDWRAEIHDSDGLGMYRGNGEWIFRPLTNPQQLRFNAFLDEHPRGFGLLQRDRNFDHYQDDGVFYDRRPSVWVEPRSEWGKGSVQLVELPASDETLDNIVAFWNPADKLELGQEHVFSYRLHWGSKMPAEPPLARAVATRTGIGGIVGQARRHFSWRFVVDFAGDVLATLGEAAHLEPVITASRGTVELTSARPLRSIRGYRVMFDVRPNEGDTSAVDLRAFLKIGDQTLTETWMYQWTPPQRQTT